MKTKMIQARISERLLGRFDEALEHDGLRRSDVVIRSISEYVEEFENRKGNSKMFEKWVQDAVDHYNEFGEVELTKENEEDVYRAVVARLETSNENFKVKDGEHFWIIKR